MRSDREAERSIYDELDEDKVAQAEAKAVRENRRAKLIAAQSIADAKALMQDSAFRRYMFTVLSKSGMYHATRHAHDGDYAYDAGRRALGLELLNDLLGIDPKFTIDLSVEQAKLEEIVERESRNEQ